MVGGVPSSDTGGSARDDDDASGVEGLDWSNLSFSARMRSTSPSSGVLSRVRVCLRGVDFFGDSGFNDVATDVNTSSLLDAAVAVEDWLSFCAAGVATSLPGFALIDRVARLMLAFDAAKWDAMPRLGAIVSPFAVLVIDEDDQW